MRQKSEIRAEMRHRRAALTEAARAEAAECIAAHLLAWLAAGERALCRLVGAYYPLSGEVDSRIVMARLRAAGHDIALPGFADARAAMRFYPWRDGDALAPGPFAALQPVEMSRAVTPDLLLLPLLAFDAAGNRLGQGGGHYDRYLARHDIPALGLAFACQRHDALPREAHDRPLHAVVTELGLHETGQK